MPSPLVTNQSVVVDSRFRSFRRIRMQIFDIASESRTEPTKEQRCTGQPSCGSRDVPCSSADNAGVNEGASWRE